MNDETREVVGTALMVVSALMVVNQLCGIAMRKIRKEEV